MLSVSSKNKLELHKIQTFMNKGSCTVKVGYPSGRQHVPTWHKDDTQKPNERRRGKYEDYNGGAPEEQDPIDTADLARDLSYGTATMPARPFLEDGLESKKEEIKNEIQKQLQNALDGKETNWDKVGTKAVAAIQEVVRSDFYKTKTPNSQKTIEYKGSDTPLIDGGDLINALTYIKEK